jgi:hypothetical protein
MSVKGLIRKKYHRIFAVNQKLRGIAKSLIDAKPQVDTPKDGIACYMLAKSYKTHGVASNLAKNGFSEDADMLVRTMFDCALIISVCLGDSTQDTAWKYLNFDYITRAKMFKQLKDQGKFQAYFEDRKNNPREGQEPVEEILANAEKFTKEYEKDFRQRWHGKLTTGDLADMAKLTPYFQTAFNLQSQLTHSLPRSMNAYLFQRGENIEMDVNPHELGADLSVVAGFNMLIVVADQFNKHFKLVPAETFAELGKEWQATIDEVVG